MTSNDDEPRPHHLSARAELVLSERGIALVWLEQALAEPDTIRPGAGDSNLVHCLRVIPEHGGKVLRVVVNQSILPRRVVTVFFDRLERKST